MISLIDAIPGSKKGEFLVNCPQCIVRAGKEDTSHKLGINTITGVYNCFRCGFKGRISDLSDLSFFTPDPTFDDARNRLIRLDEPVITESTVIDIDEISYPISKELSPNAYQYLVNRKISDDAINMFSIRVGSGYWRNRIVIPYFDSGVCKYVIGRTYTNHPKRYMNTNTSKYKVVYGIDMVKDKKCIVCEGVFSAISAYQYTGIPSVSTLGKFPTDGQIDCIRERANSVILALDGDVSDAHKLRVANMLKQRGIKVRVVDLPYGKDPDDLRGEFKLYVSKSRRV